MAVKYLVVQAVAEEGAFGHLSARKLRNPGKCCKRPWTSWADTNGICTPPFTARRENTAAAASIIAKGLSSNARPTRAEKRPKDPSPCERPEPSRPLRVL